MKNKSHIIINAELSEDQNVITFEGITLARFIDITKDSPYHKCDDCCLRTDNVRHTRCIRCRPLVRNDGRDGIWISGRRSLVIQWVTKAIKWLEAKEEAV